MSFATCARLILAVFNLEIHEKWNINCNKGKHDNDSNLRGVLACLIGKRRKIQW